MKYSKNIFYIVIFIICLLLVVATDKTIKPTYNVLIGQIFISMAGIGALYLGITHKEDEDIIIRD